MQSTLGLNGSTCCKPNCVNGRQLIPCDVRCQITHEEYHVLANGRWRKFLHALHALALVELFPQPHESYNDRNDNICLGQRH